MPSADPSSSPAEPSSNPPAAWLFGVDPDDVDLAESFADGEMVAQFEVRADAVTLLRLGQTAHLWVTGGAHGTVEAGIYATGHVVGPVELVAGDDGAAVPHVAVGLSSLRVPVTGEVLLADPAFSADVLAGDTAVENPVPLDPAAAAVVSSHRLDEGPLADVFGAVGDGDEIVLPALEVRLPEDTLLVVDGIDHDGYMVVRGTPDMSEVEELPERHETFMDAVEYVAAVAQQVSDQVPASDPDDNHPEAIAIFDATGGLYVVVKWGQEDYGFVWADDAGEMEVVDTYSSLKEAILLPVLDEELFGGM